MRRRARCCVVRAAHQKDNGTDVYRPEKAGKRSGRLKIVQLIYATFRESGWGNIRLCSRYLLPCQTIVILALLYMSMQNIEIFLNIFYLTY